MRCRKIVVVGALVTGLGLVAPGIPANAQPTVTEIASGLNSPRGLTFGPNGALYVAEAGVGGDGPCFEGPEGDVVCAGNSGAITRIWRGAQSRIVEGLPSHAAEGSGAAGTGPHDVAVQGNQLFITIGLGASAAARDDLVPGSAFGTLARATPGGRWKTKVDLAAFEDAENPDGGVPDSNPHSVAAVPGATVVADAGGNDLLRVAANGTTSVLAVFPDRLVPFPFGPGEVPMQAVPTSVVQGPDGAWYVGQLTGFPFPVGLANVYRVVPGSAPTVYADGFTNIIDIAFDPAGNLYVLEIDQDSILFGEELAGRLVRVNVDGSRDVLVDEGLFAPGGVTIGPDGAAYVTACTVCPGGGSVLRITS